MKTPHKDDTGDSAVAQVDPREAATWLHSYCGSDTDLDVLLLAAEEAGGWDEELRLISLHYLKPDAPRGQEVTP